MTAVQITISDALAKEVAAEGLLEPGLIEAILREWLRQSHAIHMIGNGRLANRFDDGVRRLPRLAGQPRDEFAPHSAERFHGVGVVEPNAGLRRFPALSRPHPSSGSRSTSDSSFRSYVVPVT